MSNKLFVTPTHECEPFQEAQNSGFIDGSTRVLDDAENFQPFCIFNFELIGSKEKYRSIKFCPFCGQNLTTL